LRIEFNPAKDVINQRKHGVSLALAERFDWNAAGFQPARTVAGEHREKALSYVDGKLYAAIYTRRGRVFWIISVRRASRKERREYGEGT
jgi:uncharacterized protein